MKAKAKGARRERQARDLLIEDGYSVVKAGGSLGLWDLVAIKKASMDWYWPVVRLIQVKSNRWPPKREMDALEKDRLNYGVGVRCEVWRFIDGKRDHQILELL